MRSWSFVATYRHVPITFRNWASVYPSAVLGFSAIWLIPPEKPSAQLFSGFGGPLGMTL